MVSNYFAVLLIISIMITVYISKKNYENIDIYYWTIAILIPLIILGYWLKTRVTTPDAAAITMCYIYLDSTVLLTVILFAILHFLRVTVNPIVKVITYLTAFAHMFIIWCCIDNDLYYKSITLVDTGMGIATKMENGPLKIVHWIYLGAMIAVILTIILIAWLKRGTYSRRTLIIYTILVTVGLGLYALEAIESVQFSNLPTLYVIADIFIAISYDRDHVHDIASLISKQQERKNSRGYAAIDLSGRYLSSNVKIYDFFPELELQIVDTKLKNCMAADVLYGLIKEFKEKQVDYKIFQVGEMSCRCEISEFSLQKNGKVQGYLFDVRDVTEEQRVLDVMQDYNDTLNAAIDKQVDKSREIRRKVVLRLAELAETQDKFVGNHIGRTSEFLRILLNEIKKQELFDISDTKIAYIMNAAPMHDFGRISVDSQIRRKKTELTEEEFASLRKHPIVSGNFVHLILDEVEEQEYIDTAYNVARYHHERWDGRGYPDGLVGEMIPVEARVMSLADAYDEAINERLSAIKAVAGDVDEEVKNNIIDQALTEAAVTIEEYMGSRLDPNMLTVFIGCREELEAAYKRMITEKLKSEDFWAGS